MSDHVGLRIKYYHVGSFFTADSDQMHPSMRDAKIGDLKSIPTAGQHWYSQSDTGNRIRIINQESLMFSITSHATQTSENGVFKLKLMEEQIPFERLVKETTKDYINSLRKSEVILLCTVVACVINNPFKSFPLFCVFILIGIVPIPWHMLFDPLKSLGYWNNLEILEKCGFKDENHNLKILKECDNNIECAVKILMKK